MYAYLLFYFIDIDVWVFVVVVFSFSDCSTFFVVDIVLHLYWSWRWRIFPTANASSFPWATCLCCSRSERPDVHVWCYVPAVWTQNCSGTVGFLILYVTRCRVLTFHVSAWWKIGLKMGCCILALYYYCYYDAVLQLKIIKRVWTLQALNSDGNGSNFNHETDIK